MATQYKIVLKRDVCIGALACSALDPEIWENTPDGKVSIIGGEKIMEGDEIKEEYIIVDSLPEERMDGAISCPVLAIEIFKLEDGEVIEKLYPQS